MTPRLHILAALSFGITCLLTAGCDFGVLHIEENPSARHTPEPVNELFDERVDCSNPELDPGAQYVRRLTNEELVNTTSDVLGVDISDLEARLPKDSYVAGFKNTATGLVVSGRHVEQYAHIAKTIAERVDSRWLLSQGACELGEAACEEQFLRKIGLKLFRRPLTDAEIAPFSRLYRVVEAEGDTFEQAQRLVVEAMVQSPQFLYRLEAQNPQARLPRRSFGEGEFRELSSTGVDFEPGRYRVSVEAALLTGETSGELTLSVGGERIESWTVGSTLLSPHFASFELGEAQAGRRALEIGADDSVRVERVELVGPIATTLDLAGPDVADDVRAVTDYEMASRLSYFIWHSSPDDVLLAEAAAGRLQTREQIVLQAERMLEDPRARRGLRSYLSQWLRLEFLDTTERSEAFPEFSRALIEAMKQETFRLFEQVIWEQKTDLLSVFTAQETWTTDELARLYGFEPKGEGEDRYDLSNIDERQGLLTHASILSLTATKESTSPVKRGQYVRTRFMCQAVLPPPGNASPDAPVISEDASTRERLAQHTEDVQCAYCHRLMDPVGFGFEHYDPIGAWRTQEPNGATIDASGRLEHTDRREPAVEFYGAPALGQILHDSEAVETCMVQNVYQYAVGRPPSRQDVCDLRQVRDGFEDQGRTYQSLVASVVASDAFRFVRVHQPQHEPTERP